MADQEHRPLPPVQFLTTDLHAAECQQTSTLLTHIQPVCPGCPWYQQSYLLHWPLQSDYRLLRLPLMLSSRTPLLLGWPLSNRGQIANSGQRCSGELSRQLPVLSRHWLHSHQRRISSPPLLRIHSLFIMNDVANDKWLIIYMVDLHIYSWNSNYFIQKSD